MKVPSSRKGGRRSGRVRTRSDCLSVLDWAATLPQQKQATPIDIKHRRHMSAFLPDGIPPESLRPIQAPRPHQPNSSTSDGQAGTCTSSVHPNPLTGCLVDRDEQRCHSDSLQTSRSDYGRSGPPRATGWESAVTILSICYKYSYVLSQNAFHILVRALAPALLRPLGRSCLNGQSAPVKWACRRGRCRPQAGRIWYSAAQGFGPGQGSQHRQADKVTGIERSTPWLN